MEGGASEAIADAIEEVLDVVFASGHVYLCNICRRGEFIVFRRQHRRLGRQRVGRTRARRHMEALSDP